jgi:hypothetical protein
LRIRFKPSSVKINGAILQEVKNEQEEGWTWQLLDKGGVLTIRQSLGTEVEIIK